MASNEASSSVQHAQDQSQLYKKPEDIESALQIRDQGVLVGVLTQLREQLIHAVKIRVDPTEKHTRPLVEYVQSCGEWQDLLDIWDYQATSNYQSLECLVPEVIGLFIRLCTTPIIRSSGLQLVQTILNRNIKYIYRGLSSMRLQQCMATFKLLANMASLSSTTTKDLFHTFNFQTEGFLRASRYRQTKKSNNPFRYLYDLRTYYVRFVLAFFIHGSPETKKQVLAVKGLLSGVFNGLDQDAYKLIEEILSVTYEHLIMDRRISRTTKTYFFSYPILEQLVKVYARNEDEPIGNGETGVPADLVHRFLLSISTIPGEGICLRDAGWYPASVITSGAKGDEGKKSDKVLNKTLSKFVGLLKAADDMRQQDLLLKILKACPELVQGYWQTASMTFEPRLSSKWLANVTVLQKIIRLPVPSLLVGDTALYSKTPPSVNTILDNILPNVFGRSTSSKGLQNTSPLVTYTTMLILATAFQKYCKAVEALEKVAVSLSQTENLAGAPLTETSSAEKWRQCLVQVREGFQRRLPVVQTLLTVHQAKKDNSNTAVTEDDLVVQQRMIKDASMRLIRYYQQCLPEAMMEAMVDPAIFIPADIFSMPPETLVHLLELLLTIPDFRWTNKAAKASFSHMTTLLTLYLQSPYQHIRDLTSRVINKFLSDSFMFRHDAEEISLWLSALPRQHFENNAIGMPSLTEEQKTVLRFIDECFDRFNKGQYRYTDESIAMVHTVNADLLHREDLPAVLGNMIKATHQSNAEKHGYTHPFSPLLLTVFQHLQSFKGERLPTIKFVTNLIVLLKTKQKVPFYLRHITKPLESYVDTTAATDIRQTGTWNAQGMVQQAMTCLSLESIEYPASEQLANNNKADSEITTFLQAENVGNVSEARHEMARAIGQTPVCVMNQCLEQVAVYCKDKLGWNTGGALVNYLCERHPAVGSIFAYKDVLKLSSLTEACPSMAAVLSALPFHIVFYNTWRMHDTSGLAISLMKQAMDHMMDSQLYNVFTTVLEELTMLLCLEKDKSHYSLALALEIFRYGFHVANESLAIRLKALVFKHPSLAIVVEHLAHQLVLTQEHNYDGVNVPFLTTIVDYMDVIAGTIDAVAVVESLMKIDYAVLDHDCKASGRSELFNTLSNLGVALVFTASQTGASKDTVLPSGAYTIIADIWRGHGVSKLDAKILQLIARDISIMSQDALSALVKAGGVHILRYILDGNTFEIDLGTLREACATSHLDIAKTIMDSLNRSPLTPNLMQLAITACDHLGADGSTCQSFVKPLMEDILRKLTETEDRSKIVAHDIYPGFYDSLNAFIKSSAVTLDWAVLDGETVRDFVLTTVMDNFDYADAIRCTGALVERVYQSHQSWEPTETYIRRILGHEKYQELTCPEPLDSVGVAACKNTDQRRAILEFVHILHKIQPEILRHNHGLIDSLLTSYSATTSDADRFIFDILQSCETSESGSLLSKMLLWGPGSDRARQTHLQSGALFKTSTINTETFGRIDPDMMEKTLMNFPIDLSLVTGQQSNDMIVYDVRFFLPLFCHLMASGLVDCRTFIECHGLGLVLVALSSNDIHTRMVGYQIMDHYYGLLEFSKFPEQSAILFVMDVFKQSLGERREAEEPFQVPSALAVSMSHAFSILLQPGHIMFPRTEQWLLDKPLLNLTTVPYFLSCFASTSSTHATERLWALRILSASIRSLNDYKVFARSQVWDLLPVFYNSVFADSESKQVVAEIFSKASKVPDITVRLIQYNGVLSWIHRLLALSDDKAELELWRSILNNFKKSAMSYTALPPLVKDLLEDQFKVLETL